MHVKHIILEGFKSYKDRTDIGPFDPHFNAITGLNGSGKSNILDSISFVLGLSSLQLVRAANLGDLVYKGNAGHATRASVSIVFDNSDKRPGKCPSRFESFDEIIVSRTVEATGTCKYYLNSITSTKRDITDLFESVQLNISNPNFVIQQGKITKVIAMTPKQILMMIEETVGGNVYQGKRDKAEHELVQKERCIASTRGVIEEEIFPEYKRQRDARDKLTEFQDIELRRTKVSKYVSLLTYKDQKDKYEQGREELKRLMSKEKENDQKTEEFKHDIDRHKKRQQQMKKENTEKFKDKIESAEKAMNVEKKSYLQIEAQVNSVKLNMEDCQKKVKDAEGAKMKEEKEMLNYKKKSANTVDEFEAVKAEIENSEAQLAKAKEQENALKMGNIVDDDGNAIDARKELSRVDDEVNKIKPDYEVGVQQFKTDQQKLRALEQELQRTPSDDQVERDYVAKRSKVEKLTAEAVRRNINPDDSTAEITRQMNQNKQAIDGFERERHNIWGQNYHLTLQYNKQAVDNSKVHGCMYELMKFHGVEEWGGALEVLFASVLGQIVVEDDATGKALLKANLSRRTAIHCLSTFRSSNNTNITQQTLDRQLGPGKAVPALDLVESDRRYMPILQHYFGGKVLCDNMETANIVAFKMGFGAVTKVGDVVNPDGLMHGGTRRNLGHLIPTVERLRFACVELKRLHAEINDLHRRMQIAKTNEEFTRTIDVAKRDLHNAEETRKLTKQSMMAQEVQALKEKLQIEEEKLKEWKQSLAKLEAEQKNWKNKVDQIENLREKNKKDNANLIAKWEKALEAAKKKYDAKKKHFEGIDVEIKSREALIADCQKEIDAEIAEMSECQKALEKVEVAFRAAEEKFKEKEAIYNEAVAESQQWNAEFNQLEEAIRELNDKITKIDVEKIKRNNLKEKLDERVQSSEAALRNITQTHKTVNFETERIPPEEMKPLNTFNSELNRLNQEHEKLRERIDEAAAEQCGNTKLLLVDAESKLKKVRANRNDLVKCIEQLDGYKLDLVVQAYDKVNEEFNKMMGTLLPDSAARLVPVNPDDFCQGLNIHVQLGGVWKESLGELSGGQKSLVALALVLSLCMYNPAPFYILDEIDSALDLNHTQNIGVLIKRRFTGTQFICVSLKDGMYSNCNILFQVQFVNGKSEVKRCVRQSSRKANDEAETSYTSKKGNKRFKGIAAS